MVTEEQKLEARYRALSAAQSIATRHANALDVLNQDASAKLINDAKKIYEWLIEEERE